MTKYAPPSIWTDEFNTPTIDGLRKLVLLDAKKAFDKAINNANKVAMSLSDQFCVDRHKPHFLELVKKYSLNVLSL